LICQLKSIIFAYLYLGKGIAQYTSKLVIWAGDTPLTPAGREIRPATLHVIKGNKNMRNFVVYHIEKCAANVTGLGKENYREYGIDEKVPPNIDVTRSHLNQYLIRPKNLNKAIDERIKEGYKAPYQIKSNAVKAITIVLSGSQEPMNKMAKENPELFQSWVETNQEFLEKKYGKENVVSLVLHLDETTPHLQAVIVPLTPDGRLSAKEVMGNRIQMRKTQDEYAQAMKPFGLERGLEGSKAKHEDVKEYYTRINHDLPKIKKELQELNQTLPTLKKEAEQLKNEVADYSKMKVFKETTGAITGAIVSKLTKKDETKELRDQVQHLQEENANLKTGLNNAAANLSEFERATERLYQENQKLKSAIGGQDQQRENELSAAKARATNRAVSLINGFARKNFNLPGSFDIKGDTVHFEHDKGQSQGLSR
jgi:archaellum component FlaC